MGDAHVAVGSRIVAPATAASDVRDLAAAGADEIYCGYMPDQWAATYGDWDSATRRQGPVANITSLEALREVARAARSAGVPAALAMNVRYTREQVGTVAEIIAEWESAGGSSVIVSSAALLVALVRSGAKVRKHLSLLANVTNALGVEFFQRWGVTRIVLPRELSIADMGAIASKHPELEFEAMALHDKCRFADGLCGFYHGTRFPREASMFGYERHQNGERVTRRCDLCYAGHGCQVPFVTETGQAVWQPPSQEPDQPACAACSLASLASAGIRYLKIGGRGLPLSTRLQSVAFLRRAADLAKVGARESDMMNLYAGAFGRPCGSTCYYRGSLGDTRH